MSITIESYGGLTLNDTRLFFKPSLKTIDYFNDLWLQLKAEITVEVPAKLPFSSFWMHLLVGANEIIWVSKGERKIRHIELNHISRPPSWSFFFRCFARSSSTAEVANILPHPKGSRNKLRATVSWWQLPGLNQQLVLMSSNVWKSLLSFFVPFTIIRLELRLLISKVSLCFDQTSDETEQVVASARKSVFMCSHGSKAGMTRLTCSSRKAEAILECDGRCENAFSDGCVRLDRSWLKHGSGKK